MQRGILAIILILLISAFGIHEYYKTQQLKLINLKQKQEIEARTIEVAQLKKQLQKIEQKTIQKIEQKTIQKIDEQDNTKRPASSEKKEIVWTISFDEANKMFQIQVKNHSQNQAELLTKKIQFLATCATTALLHQKSHMKNVEVAPCDLRWAKAIMWALSSVGQENLQITNDIGKLGQQLNEWLKPLSNQKSKHQGYATAREILMLAWSDQAELLLKKHLNFDLIQSYLKSGLSSPKEQDHFQIQVISQKENNVRTLQEVTFQISYTNLLLAKNPQIIHQLRQLYYLGVSHKYQEASQTAKILQQLYPHPQAKIAQTELLSNVNIRLSSTLYQNLLRNSLWEQRLAALYKKQNKFWIALQCLAPEIADGKGKINPTTMNLISKKIKQRIAQYFLTPIKVRRVLWHELKNKQDGVNLETSRDQVGAEEIEGLLRFVERSTMAQYPEKKKNRESQAWYNSFSFVLNRPVLDRIPHQKWVYLKTATTNANGEQSRKKVYLFKRDGIKVTSYPESEYDVDIFADKSLYNYFIKVTDLSVYQKWFRPHPSQSVYDDLGSPDKNRLRVDLFYELNGKEYQVVRAGDIKPIMIDFTPQRNSFLLFEISGYNASPALLTQLLRDDRFNIDIDFQDTKWRWTIAFNNGPLIVPFAYQMGTAIKPCFQSIHELSWPKSVLPDKEIEDLVSLTDKYKIQILYADSEAQLPITTEFFPYKNINEIMQAYKAGNISTTATAKRIEGLFSKHDQISNTQLINWDKDLAKFYQKDISSRQIFRHWFQNEHHKFTINAPEVFELPKNYPNSKHPVIEAPRNSLESKTAIIKIEPIEQSKKDGFPKYIIERRLVGNIPYIFVNDK